MLTSRKLTQKTQYFTGIRYLENIVFKFELIIVIMIESKLLPLFLPWVTVQVVDAVDCGTNEGRTGIIPPKGAGDSILSSAKQVNFCENMFISRIV